MADEANILLPEWDAEMPDAPFYAAGKVFPAGSDVAFPTR